MENSVSITSEILEQALLLNIETGMWSGKSSQDDADLQAQGVKAETSLFIRGQKLLVPKESLEVFSRIKSRIAKYLSREARRFYIKGTWIVSRDSREVVSDEMSKFEREWTEAGERFIQNLPSYREKMLEIYREKFPSIVEKIQEQYPTDQQIRDKCKLHWTFGQWSMAQVENAAVEMEQQFRARANSYLSQLEEEVYVSSVEAAIAMAKGINNKTGVVSTRKVEKFKALINRIRQDNQAFLNSERIQDFLSSVDQNVFNVKAWETEGAAKEKVKQVLEGYIADAAKNSEAAAEIANAYVRRSSIAIEEDEDDEEEDVAETSAAIRRLPSLSNDEIEDEGEEE